MYSARVRVVRSGVGIEAVVVVSRALWGMAISSWVIGFRPVSIRRTVALVDSIWDFV